MTSINRMICFVVSVRDRDWSYQSSPLFRRGSSFNASEGSSSVSSGSLPPLAPGTPPIPPPPPPPPLPPTAKAKSASFSHSQKPSPRRLSWFNPMQSDGRAGKEKGSRQSRMKARTLSIDQSDDDIDVGRSLPPPPPPPTPTAQSSSQDSTHFRMLNSLRTSFRRNSFLRNRKDFI